MTAFAPVTEADLAQARSDPVFRKRLLEQNLEALLVGLRALRCAAPPAGSVAEKQMREAVALAVRLAELIQGPGKPTRAAR